MEKKPQKTVSFLFFFPSFAAARKILITRIVRASFALLAERCVGLLRVNRQSNEQKYYTGL